MSSDDLARLAAKAAADAEQTLRVVGGTAGLQRLARQTDIAFTASKRLTPGLQDAIANAIGASAVAKTTQAIATSVMPKLDVSALMPKLDVSWLMPKLDFAFVDQLQFYLSPGYQRLAEQIAASLPKITLPTFPTITLPRFLPPNLHGLDFDLDLLTTLAAEGITLYRVPGRSVTERLLRAPDKAARRAILGRALPQILDDCDAVLDVCTSSRARESSLFARSAIAAARAGHIEAAQALLTNTLDTTLGLLPDRKAATSRTRRCAPRSTTRAFAPSWYSHRSGTRTVATSRSGVTSSLVCTRGTRPHTVSHTANTGRGTQPRWCCY